MRIKKIKLKNGYKRFYDLTIDLGVEPARIVALVGPNGCGKSSVLDGLIFHQQAHERIGVYSSNYESSYHSMRSDSPVTYENIEIDFVEGSFSEVRRARSELGKSNTVFSFRSPYRYNNHVKIDQIRATKPIRDNSDGASFSTAIDSKMEENYRRLQAKINSYMETNDLKPSEARAFIIGQLNLSIKRCLDLEIHSAGNIEAGQGSLYFKKPDHPNAFDFNVLSSGEKEVIDILLDLYLRKDDFDNSVFLIDEPELHINTAIQGKLLIEIDHLVGKNCQIWLTTHSIGFLRALQSYAPDNCQIIQIKADFQLASSPYTLTPMKKSAAAWRELFAVALEDLATLISPKTIIYCEGRDAPGTGGLERGMDARALNAIFAKSHPDALFISSGGNTELDQRSTIAITLLSKVFPDIEILVFKDRDMVSGRVANEHDRQLYLSTNPANHRVMRRFELENYLYDKDVLKAYCLGNDLQFDDEGYDSFVTDVTNQNLKDATGRIKKICSISNSINSETFKVSLGDYFNEKMQAYIELKESIFERK